MIQNLDWIEIMTFFSFFEGFFHLFFIYDKLYTIRSTYLSSGDN